MQGIFAGTFLIGLREGLEATLIVGIIGAFLARNGRSLRPMVIGVGAAVTASIAVGVGLDLLAAALPQRQQEALETVVGAVAVVFVTTMIIWMNRNAMHLRGELETDAARAVERGGAVALAVMAFLAVLKEGFETAVFLLAAAESTHGSRWAAVGGATAGIAVAVAVGVGIFVGGLKLDLGRFFRATGIFLILIAAGLVVGTLRSAHEAGWVDAGQGRVVDLSGWISPGSLPGAVITGMFGIPGDPRLIEVLAWLLYAVPVLVVFLWPARLASSPRARRAVLIGAAAGLALVAATLAIDVPADAVAPGSTRAAAHADGSPVTVTLGPTADAVTISVDGAPPVVLDDAGPDPTSGELWQAATASDDHPATATTTLARLTALSGGRIPVGLSAARTPGPFDVSWRTATSYTVVLQGDSILSARAEGNRTAALRNGGLDSPKTVSLGGTGADWATSDDEAITAAVAAAPAERADRTMWHRWLPAVLALGAATATWFAVRRGERGSRTTKEKQSREDPSADRALGVS